MASDFVKVTMLLFALLTAIADALPATFQNFSQQAARSSITQLVLTANATNLADAVLRTNYQSTTASMLPIPARVQQYLEQVFIDTKTATNLNRNRYASKPLSLNLTVNRLDKKLNSPSLATSPPLSPAELYSRSTKKTEDKVDYPPYNASRRRFHRTPQIRTIDGGDDNNDIGTLDPMSLGDTYDEEDKSDPFQDDDYGAMPAHVVDTQVKCDGSTISIALLFDKPFTGIIYARDLYENAECIFWDTRQQHTNETDELPHQQMIARFRIPMFSCGTTATPATLLSESQITYESVLIIQQNPDLVEKWDESMAINCNYDLNLNKTVQWKWQGGSNTKQTHYSSNNIRSADTSGSNMMTMQLQVGKGPLAVPVRQSVPIGSLLTAVLKLNDANRILDANVLSCSAFDADRQNTLSLIVDGCVVRPNIIKSFIKAEAVDGSGKLLFAYIQAFRFPTSKYVYLECEITVCYLKCQPLKCRNEQQEQKHELVHYLSSSRDDETVNRNKADAEQRSYRDDETVKLKAVRPLMALRRREASFDNLSDKPSVAVHQEQAVRALDHKAVLAAADTISVEDTVGLAASFEVYSPKLDGDKGRSAKAIKKSLMEAANSSNPQASLQRQAYSDWSTFRSDVLSSSTPGIISISIIVFLLFSLISSALAATACAKRSTATTRSRTAGKNISSGGFTSAATTTIGSSSISGVRRLASRTWSRGRRFLV